MELIRFDRNGGAVEVHISIAGILSWGYVYAGDKDFTDKGNEQVTKVHILGMPHDLENDTNSWSIRLANLSDENQEYEIQLTWTQNDKLLKKWPATGPRKGEVEPDSIKFEKDDALLIGA